MRHNNPAGSVYEGAILIDNVTVTAETPVSTSTINNKFLSDDAFNAFFADTLTQVDAASIRLRDPSGLRFASLVDDHKLAHLKTIFGKDATFKMGTLITPYAYAKAAGDTVVTRASLDALDITSAKYLDVEFDGTYFQGETGMDVGENTYMVGSIVNIKANNITRQFAGIGYLEIVVGEDVVASQYTTPTYRSVQVVAQAALEAQTAGNVTFTTGQNAILAAYAAGQQPS